MRMQEEKQQQPPQQEHQDIELVFQLPESTLLTSLSQLSPPQKENKNPDQRQKQFTETTLRPSFHHDEEKCPKEGLNDYVVADLLAYHLALYFRTHIKEPISIRYHTTCGSFGSHLHDTYPTNSRRAYFCMERFLEFCKDEIQNIMTDDKMSMLRIVTEVNQNEKNKFVHGITVELQPHHPFDDNENM